MRRLTSLGLTSLRLFSTEPQRGSSPCWPVESVITQVGGVGSGGVIITILITVDSSDVTLLHWAALNNRAELASLLIDRGVAVDSVGGETGGSSLHWAAHSGSLAAMSVLVSRQARLDLPDSDGCLPIHVAAALGHNTCIVYLIAKGQQVDTVDCQGRTPLMLALARSDSPDTAALLVKLGANIASVDNNHNNPLHWAVSSGKARRVANLVNISQQPGCNQRIRWEDKNRQGKSALDIINREKRCLLTNLPGPVKHYIRKDILLRKFNNPIRKQQHLLLNEQTPAVTLLKALIRKI